MCNELATWLSALAGKDISSDLVDVLYDGIVWYINFVVSVGIMWNCKEESSIYQNGWLSY